MKRSADQLHSRQRTFASGCIGATSSAFAVSMQLAAAAKAAADQSQGRKVGLQVISLLNFRQSGAGARRTRYYKESSQASPLFVVLYSLRGAHRRAIAGAAL